MVNIEISEREVIGRIVESPNKLEQIDGILTAEMFRNQQCRDVMKIINTLKDEQTPIDLNMIRSRSNTQTMIAVSNMAMSACGNFNSHVKQIYENHLRSELIFLGEELRKSGNDKGVYQKINEVRVRLDELEQSNTVTSLLSADDVVKLTLETDNTFGVPTGFKRIDDVTAGLKNGKFYVLAGRPGMGKTSMMQSMAFNISQQGIPVGIFSLEVPLTELHAKIRSYESGVPAFLIENDRCSPQQISDLAQSDKNNKGRKIYYDSSTYVNVSDLKRKVNAMKKQGVKVIFIDYLQLIKPSDRYKGNKVQEVGEISETLKSTARSCDIPVVALAQLSRAVETRGGAKIPLLSDLRETGNIEQDADVVAFMYRGEYYGFEGENDYDDWSVSNVPFKDTASFIIAKHRGGRLSTIPLDFNKNQTRFKDYRYDDSDFVKKALETDSYKIDSRHRTEETPF